MRSLQLVAFRLKALNVYIARSGQEGVVGKTCPTPLILSFRNARFSPGLRLKPHLEHAKAHPGVGWLRQWLRRGLPQRRGFSLQRCSAVCFHCVRWLPLSVLRTQCVHFCSPCPLLTILSLGILLDSRISSKRSERPDLSSALSDGGQVPRC